MRHLRWLMLAVLCLAVTAAARAQSVDAFFGFNTLLSKANPTSGAPKMGSGFYPSAGGDVMFLPHHLGVGVQVAWRGGTQAFQGETAQGVESFPARPILYDFNLVWQPVTPGAKIRPDFAIGFGGESLRFYQGQYTCSAFSCSDYVSSKHLLWHVGVGLKYYVTGHIFLRPGLDYYGIRNNTEYGAPHVWQVGVAIGYTLGPSS